MLPARVAAMCAVELQKLRHDRTELYTRAIQPALWLLIFGETFTRIHAIRPAGSPTSTIWRRASSPSPPCSSPSSTAS